MTTRTPRKTVALASVLCAFALVGAACSSGDDGAEKSDRTTSTTESTTTTAADGSAVTTAGAPGDDIIDVVVQPGESDDGFVGARQDVTLDRCEKVDDGWIASGEVTNTSGSDASYRIYLALNITDSSITRALVQVDAAVADGDTQPWEVTVPRSEIWGLECILRVERVAA